MLRSTSPLYNARELSPEQRRTIESLLGRALEDDEVVSIDISKGQIVKRAPTGEAREKAFRDLFDRIDRTAQRVEGIPEAEIDAAIDEAVDYVRHHSE
jgi:hypothetical protein